MLDQAQTPISDHIRHFWETLQEKHVHILIDIRRDHDEGQPPHWDSTSFPDDVAKALVAERRSPAVSEETMEYQAKVAAKAIFDVLSPGVPYTREDAYYYGLAAKAAFEATGARCSGSISVSKTDGDGSIPSASANVPSQPESCVKVLADELVALGVPSEQAGYVAEQLKSDFEIRRRA